MKKLFSILSLVLLAAALCAAQTARPDTAALAQRPAQPIETAFTFDALVANAPPGGCGCFTLSGFSESAAYSFTNHWSAVAEAGAAWQSNVDHTGLSLDFGRLLAGPRYTWHREQQISWFAQGLLGIAHQSGTGYTAATAFAFQPGAGVDIALGHGLLFRPAELDYLRTALPNARSNRQNTLRYSIGFVFRFGGH